MPAPRSDGGLLLADLEASVNPRPPISRAAEPVRFSNLKNMGQSPAHYLAALTSPRVDTEQFRIGRIVDSALLGGPSFVPWEGKQRRGKVWDAWSAKQASLGNETCSLREYETGFRCAEAVSKHPHAMYLLRSGIAKKRLYWSYLGRKCSGEPDVHGQYLVDLKTTRSAHPFAFVRQGLGFAYHAQIAWYRLGMLQAGLVAPSECFNVAVETRAPYPVTVFCLTPRAIERGEALCRGWMERLLQCEAVNEWPGYAQSAVDFDVPDDRELVFGDESDAAA